MQRNSLHSTCRTALALATLGGVAVAGGEHDDWLALDREIGALAAGATSANPGALEITGFIRTRYSNSGDVNADPTFSGNDLGGFSIENARLDFVGTLGDFVLNIALEGSSSAPDTPATYGTGGGNWAMFGDVDNVGGVAVLDANATWIFNPALHVTAGQFLVPFSSNAAVREDRMLFLNHTVSGEHWRFRDTGLMVSGEHQRFGWQVALTNGFDAAGEELAKFVRGYVNLLDGAPPITEGAYGNADQRLRVAAAWYSDDDNNADDTAWTIDAAYLRGPFSAAVEAVHYDDGATSVYTNNQQGVSNIVGDRSAVVVQAGWLFDPSWEAAARFEDLDDDNDTSVMTFGVNYYVEGHAAKVQLNYSAADSDDPLLEADIVALGLTLSI